MTQVPGSTRRLWLSIALAALVAAGCSGGGSPTLLSVGSRKVTVDEFKELARQPGMLEPYSALPESLQKRAMFNDLIDYETLVAAALQDGLDKDSAFVKFARSEEERLLPDALYEAKIGSLARVSDDEAKLFYAQQDTEYQLAIIMTSDSTLMQSLLQRVDRGEPFEAVARAGSQDPATAPDGGRLPGWFTLGQFSPKIEDAIRALPKGGHTRALPQRQGTFAFKLLDTRPRKDTPDFATQKEVVKRTLLQRKRSALADDYLAGLKRSHEFKIGGDGWTVVHGVMVSLPESLSHYLGTDPARAGLTPQDLDGKLASWKGRTYKVKDLLADLKNADMQDRPPSNRTDLFPVFIEGKAMTEILVTEARREGVDKSPKFARQLDQVKSGYLAKAYLAKKMPMPSQPTIAELDSVTAVLVAASGGSPQPIRFQQLPSEAQQQVAERLQGEKQKALMRATVDRAKAELKPNVNEKAFDAIAWPVEPEPQEKA